MALDRDERELFDQLLAAVQRLSAENERLKAENERLKAENERLRKALEDARRAGKRQAAPFSKGDPKPDPKPPGRKPGDQYGEHHRRAVPTKIDRTLEAPLPARCPDPDCAGGLAEYDVADQYQIDIPPVAPIVTRFRIHVGMCTCCGKRVQGRHPEQTSDALGACRVQIGPEAVCLAAYLNKTCGVSWGRIADLFGERFGLDVERSTLCRAAVEQLAERLRATVEDMVNRLYEAAVVYADETGWKVSGLKRWLWVFVTERLAVYLIRGGRDAGVLDEVLGLDWSGILVRDGWKAYGKLTHALHQTCLCHLLRRCKESLETAVGPARAFPQAVKELLQDALALRERIGEISEHGLTTAVGRLQARCTRLLADRQADADNERFRKHLMHERDYLFTFLKFWQSGVEPTNNIAERAQRGPAVVNRKVSGGNRSDAGAEAQGILVSFIQTCLKQGRNALRLMVGAMKAVGRVVFPLAGPPESAVGPPAPAT